MKNGSYILIKAPLDYSGKKYRGLYIYEHVFVWWKITKIIPPEGYQIHHKNGNRVDNRFENLEMVFKSTHAKIHNGKKTRGITLLICAWCNDPFEIPTRNYKFKTSQGQKEFHCCRSCQVYNQQWNIRKS